MRWAGLIVFLGITLTILFLSSVTFATGLRPPCDNYGDVDFDGYITTRDKSWVLEYEAELRAFSPKQIERADVNDDSFTTSLPKDVSSVDALFIDQYVHGLIDTFPVCRAVCGNNKLETGEKCDDGNRMNGDGCNSLCKIEFCGDGITQKSLGEQCDDGNNKNGDGCDFKCKTEIKPTTTTTTLKSTTSTTTTYPTTTTTLPACKNECSSWGVKECVNNGFRVCGNFDSDVCFEWSDIGLCPASTVCSLGKCIPISTTTTTFKPPTSTTTTTFPTSSTTTTFPATSTSTTTTSSTTTTAVSTTTLPSCVNECSNERFCTNEFSYKVCGNFDEDSCLELGLFGCGKGEMCNNGFCVAATYTGCANECSSWNVKQCSGNGYQVCGNWDSDSCFEWSNVTVCSNVCKSGRCV